MNTLRPSSQEAQSGHMQSGHITILSNLRHGNPLASVSRQKRICLGWSLRTGRIK